MDILRKQNDSELAVIGYYDDWSEDVRMTRDKGRNIEYITTMNFIRRYLKTADKVLELGCGTGIYSLALASKGHSITAVDISEKNLDILRTSISKGMDIKVYNMNATNLEMIDDNSQDVTLLLGPLYHLFDESDIDKVIEEAKRVTTSGGLIYISFLSKDYITVRNCEKVFDESNRYLDNNYKFVNDKKEIFYYFYLDEFEHLMDRHKLEKLHFLTTDGISRFINDKIINLSVSGYKRYLNYIFHNCERRELMGFSPHLLYVAKNN